MDRGFALMSKGQILDRPGPAGQYPTALDPTMAAQGTHVLSLEALFTPYGFVNGWGTNSEAQRWLDQYATLLHPGFQESLRDWRVMTPATYEREFYLPQGHATSFAGGPLAALRNKNPRANPLRHAGSGTVPDRCGNLSRRRSVGRQRSQHRTRGAAQVNKTLTRREQTNRAW